VSVSVCVSERARERASERARERERERERGSVKLFEEGVSVSVSLLLFTGISVYL